MDFSLSKTQQMTQQALREFVRKEIGPLAQESDQNAQFPLSSYRQILDLDVLEMTLPQDMGGFGDDYLSFILALEEIASGSAVLALSLSVSETVLYALIRHGIGDHQSALEVLRKGQAFGAITPIATDGLVYQTATGDPADRGKTYLLNGTIAHMPLASMSTFAIVFARSGKGNYGAFMVNTQLPGVATAEPQELMGMQGLPIGPLVLDAVHLPSENRLAGDNLARPLLSEIQARTHIAIATLAVGISRAALEAAVDHGNHRVQFGRPLVQMEATQNKIADMASAIESARLLVYRAASLMPPKRHAVQQVNETAAMAKLIASNAAVEICREAVQIHGGYGYVKDYPVERYYRDALFTQVYSTTNTSVRYEIADRVCRRFKH